MPTGNPQSSILPAVAQRGEKRLGVIDSAAYVQGGRVANVEIADLSEEIKREDRFVWVGLYEPDEKLLGEIQEEFRPPRPGRRGCSLRAPTAEAGAV